MDEQIANGSDNFLFAAEQAEIPTLHVSNNPWKIIIADDEKEIHQITQMVLNDYVFDKRNIQFFSAYTGEETKRLIEENPDTAIILLDVVMETDSSGLEVAQYIRQTLKNSFVRIILRTGQPGKAPEKKIIMEYDINEYKEKTELTTQKLFTTITSSLRSYKDLITIDRTRQVLELVIKSSERIFENQSLKRFTTGLLNRILSILRLDQNAMYIQASGFAASYEQNDFRVIAATGRFESFIDQDVRDVVPKEIQQYLRSALEKKEGIFIDDAYIGYFSTETGSTNLIYLNGCRNLTALEKDLIRIFSSNISIAFDNLYLSQEIVDTQKEVIFTLGELVDTRSKGMANHVRRVAEFSRLLALKAGLREEEAELLKLASPMHDVGKIGIPDSILNKPGALSDDEYCYIKSHSQIGFEILKNSKREILKAATIVAQQHHERWDGSGYPQGLKGEQIHIFGRITGLADVFDALTHNRIYKKAWPIQFVIDYFKDNRGKYFDPRLVDLFIQHIDEFLEINKRFPEKEG